MCTKSSANPDCFARLEDGAIHNVAGAYIIGAITLVGVFLRFYGLGDKPIWGDELGSLLEAEKIIENPHSIVFYLIMHFWEAISISTVWNRALGAI